MTDIVKGMAIAGWHKGNPALQNHLQCFPETQAEEEAKMRAALLWLSEHVTDEMLYAAKDEAIVQDAKGASELEGARALFAAAIRAAAGEEGK